MKMLLTIIPHKCQNPRGKFYNK